MAKGSGKDIYGEQDYGMANKVSGEALSAYSKQTTKGDINGVKDGRAKGDDLKPGMSEDVDD